MITHQLLMSLASLHWLSEDKLLVLTIRFIECLLNGKIDFTNEAIITHIMFQGIPEVHRRSFYIHNATTNYLANETIRI